MYTEKAFLVIPFSYKNVNMPTNCSHEKLSILNALKRKKLRVRLKKYICMNQYNVLTYVYNEISNKCNLFS